MAWSEPVGEKGISFAKCDHCDGWLGSDQWWFSGAMLHDKCKKEIEGDCNEKIPS